MKYLDVLVIYNSRTSVSAAVDDSVSQFPFLLGTSSQNYLPAYEEFLHACSEKGLSAGFSTAADVIRPGVCSSYWTLSGKKWNKHIEEVTSLNVFDKFSATDPYQVAQRSLLLSDPKIKTFNNPKLFSLFFDKLSTYELFPWCAIPTVAIASAKKEDIVSSVADLQELIKQHPFSKDFNPGYVLKDRYGASGNNVFLIQDNFITEIQKTLQDNKDTTFILQPFLAFDRGITFQGAQRSTDVRLIFYNNTVIQTYFRLAKENEFRCNEHKGGKVMYVSLNEVPSSIRQLSNEIVRELNSPESLFALDFLMSNSGNAYFLEGNYGPGLDWNPNVAIDEQMAKQLIHTIVDEFHRRVQTEKHST